MLDPRIYRMWLIPIALAVIVLAFSLEDQPAGLGTSLAPDVFSGPHAYRTMQYLARWQPSRRPGSAGDQALASYVASQLASDRFTVSTDTYTAHTVDGLKTIENVIGERAGLLSGTIAIVSHRDALGSPATAELSGTAVMLELARDLSGETQQHTVVLASISGSVGAVGAARLAQTLPQPVDAVIVLGDMAGTSVTKPVIVPYSDDQRVAPPMLRNTVAGALSAQAGISAGANSLGGQIAHLAFPMSSSEQAPLNSAGEPAVLLSLSGQRAPAADEPTSVGRIAGMGRAVLESLSALDGGQALPAPSAYLVWSGKIVPAWAIRLLALMLILPVAAATIDGLARARRRGYPIGRWVAWVLAAGLPFCLAALVVIALTREVGLVGLAPATPIEGGTVSPGASGDLTLCGLALVIVGGLVWLRRLVVHLLGPSPRQRADHTQRAGAAAAVMLVLCAVCLAVWWSNPFAALLLAPALHFWLLVVAPEVRLPVAGSAVLLLAGLTLPLLALAYYSVTLGLGVLGTAWSGVLLLAGGAVGWSAALEWSLVGGCVLSVMVIALRARRAPKPESAPITVRGPVGYAGPGSLGGTESALRR